MSYKQYSALSKQNLRNKCNYNSLLQYSCLLAVATASEPSSTITALRFSSTQEYKIQSYKVKEAFAA